MFCTPKLQRCLLCDWNFNSAANNAIELRHAEAPAHRCPAGTRIDVPKKEFLWMAAYIVPKPVSVNGAVPDAHVTHDAMGTYTRRKPSQMLAFWTQCWLTGWMALFLSRLKDEMVFTLRLKCRLIKPNHIFHSVSVHLRWAQVRESRQWFWMFTWGFFFTWVCRCSHGLC